MSPSTFTVGPRGRRVLLELAMMLDDDVRRAASALAYSLDPARGQGRTVFGWMDGVPDAEFEEAYLAGAPTPLEFATLLEGIDLPGGGPEASSLHAAVTASVDDARYWQEPSGEDVLTTRKELRRALRRLAAWAAPAAPAWWTGPMDPKQYAIAWGDTPLHRYGDVETWKERAVAEEQTARAELPEDPTANYSGTWWSFPGGPSSTRMIDENPLGLGWREDGTEAPARLFPLDTTGARVLEIEDTSAWVTLCWDQPLEVTASRRHDWYRVTGRAERWVIPDWAQLARRYDAVHLHTRAYLAGATQALTVDAGILTMIAGWGPDETRWLTTPTVGDPTRWELTSGDGGAPHWQPAATETGKE